MQNPTENDRKPDERAGCAVAVGSAFAREPRYFVVKLSDARKHLSRVEWDKLRSLGSTVACGRKLEGKSLLQCVVVESDWPEYEPTWRAIEARMTGTAPNFDRLRYALEEAERTKSGARLADYADDIRALLTPNPASEPR